MSDFQYLGLDGLSDDQLDILTRSAQNGFKTTNDGQLDTGFYDGRGSQRYNSTPRGQLGMIFPGIDGGRDPKTDPSLLWKQAFDGDFTNIDSAKDVSQMFMRVKDERVRRQIQGMTPAAAPAAKEDSGPDLLNDDRELQKDTQDAIDRATQYERDLGNYGTDVFGERNSKVYGYDYDWQNGIRPEGTPGRDDEASEKAGRFADKYKLDVANNMSPGDRKSAVDAPVNVTQGVSLFGR